MITSLHKLVYILILYCIDNFSKLERSFVKSVSSSRRRDLTPVFHGSPLQRGAGRTLFQSTVNFNFTQQNLFNSIEDIEGL